MWKRRIYHYCEQAIARENLQLTASGSKRAPNRPCVMLSYYLNNACSAWLSPSSSDWHTKIETVACRAYLIERIRRFSSAVCTVVLWSRLSKPLAQPTVFWLRKVAATVPRGGVTSGVNSLLVKIWYFPWCPPTFWWNSQKEHRSKTITQVSLAD